MHLFMYDYYSENRKNEKKNLHLPVKTENSIAKYEIQVSFTVY